MASIPQAQATIGGVVLSATAATSGPDKVPPDDRAMLLAENTGSSGATVDVVVPGNTRWGQDQPDVTSVSIPAGSLGAIGNLPTDLADPSDGMIHVIASSTSVNLYVVRV